MATLGARGSGKFAFIIRPLGLGGDADADYMCIHQADDFALWPQTQVDRRRI